MSKLYSRHREDQKCAVVRAKAPALGVYNLPSGRAVLSSSATKHESLTKYDELMYNELTRWALI